MILLSVGHELQKPKKKKAESVPAQTNGTDAKPKKTKSKKNEDLSGDESPAVQSKSRPTPCQFEILIHMTLVVVVIYRLSGGRVAEVAT